MKLVNLWMTTPLFFALSLTLTGCSKDTSEPSKSSSTVARFLWTEKSVSAESEIKIINQYNEPIEGAQILIGNAQGSPFRNNFITTDKLGAVTTPAEWVTPASITVNAQGYIRQTLLNVNPGNLILKMNTAYLAQRAEVRGQVTQLPIVNGDKLIDFALVMPVLLKADLLNFDIGQVISPYSDILSAAGQESPVPSNISIPKQKESYFIGVTLDKPVYRLKMPTLGPKKFVATRGRFVFKTIVSELRNGKPFQDLINHFSILGGSIREATLTGPTTNLDIPGNELSFNNTLSVNSVAIQSDEILLLLATSEVAGSMIPTDVKRAVNGQPTNLQSISNKPTYIVSAIKKQSEFISEAPGADRISVSLLPYSAATSQRLLPLVANPTIVNSKHYIINLPNLPTTAGINPIAISASISDLTEIQDANKKILLPNRKWEIFGLGWEQQISLPQWPLENVGARQRVEINYIGSTSKQKTNLDDSLIENATHITHASTDF